MCGILSIFDAADPSSLRDQTLRAVKAIRHRGPDCGGLVVIDGKHAVAHERLAVVDPRSGAQPFVFAADTPNQVVCAVNGEIYNHATLRFDAWRRDRFNFQSRSDCEVVVPMYLRAAAAATVPASTEEPTAVAFADNLVTFVRELDGMFAFVLHDRARNTYVAARDHLGIIPLYVGRGRDGSTWFSSEMKALLVGGACTDVTVFPPGHLFISSDQEPPCAAARPRYRYRPWYTPPWARSPSPGTTILPLPTGVPADLVRIRVLLEHSVYACMRSDTPWGVLLSGGLDSSLVAAIATRAQRAADAVTGLPTQIASFTIGLAGSPDVLAAERVAAFLGTRHHSYTFTVQQGLDALRDVVYHLETYDVTSIRAGTPMFLMSRFIRSQGVKMVLSGEGADEIFGGYLYFHRAPSREEFAAETADKLRALHLYDCNRANKSTAAWGVEARVPFLDRAFVDYCMSFDPVNKMIDKELGFIEKYVLRAAFFAPRDPYLPPEILWRQKEQFSDGVGYAWIDGLRAFAETRVSDAALADAPTRFEHNPPRTKEAYVYREMFEEHFPPGASCEHTVPGGFSIACSTARAYAWDDAFRGRDDPSGRACGVHDHATPATAAAALKVAAPLPTGPVGAGAQSTPAVVPPPWAQSTVAAAVVGDGC